MKIRSYVLSLSVIITFFTASTSYAQWKNEYGNTVASSQKGEVVFTCDPAGVSVRGPSFGMYFKEIIPIDVNPEVVFIFDGNDVMEWSKNYGADMYVGPVENPYGTAADEHTLTLIFGNYRAAIHSWVDLAEAFMEHNSVTVRVNGRSIGPISLKGSKRALEHIAYLTDPC